MELNGIESCLNRLNSEHKAVSEGDGEGVLFRYGIPKSLLIPEPELLGIPAIPSHCAPFLIPEFRN